MRILITGVCGFVGSSLAMYFRQQSTANQIVGVDNLIRPGSETNRKRLAEAGVQFVHGDLRIPSDLEALQECEWVIDAAANPSVLAGKDGKVSSRQLVEHNLGGTINLLEYCRRTQAGLVLLSTSRVYSIPALGAVPLREGEQSFQLDTSKPLPRGLTPRGITEDFPTTAPISLYGSTKLASEVLASEYGEAFGFPVWIDRCGVLAGPGQFGTAEQGIFSYWLHAHAAKRRIRYIGFEGTGKQVRDALHPDDLGALLLKQIASPQPNLSRVWNVGGGLANSMSLAQLNTWCDNRFGIHRAEADLTPRLYDIPWFVTDYSRTEKQWDWRPHRSLGSILDEIGRHVDLNPGWLERSGA